MKYAMDGKAFRKNYDKVKSEPGKLWDADQGRQGQRLHLAQEHLHRRAAVLRGLHDGAQGAGLGVQGARIMGLFGDSITTDHISPAGSFKETTPAGKYLLDNGVLKADFNSYGARRGNHEVMMRGTFANVRIKNLMLPPMEDGARQEGGYTLYQAAGPARARRCRSTTPRCSTPRPASPP